MGQAPKAIWDVWYLFEDTWKGVGPQDEVLSGIVGDKDHSFGYHLAPNELPAYDYSLIKTRDRIGARKYPGMASALDIHLGPQGMKLATARLVAAAKKGDARLKGVREFAGTTNGSSVHTFDLSKGKSGDNPNNTDGWDSGHLTHIHISFYRDASNTFDAIKGIVSVMCGTPAQAPKSVEEEAMAFYADKAAFEAAIEAQVKDVFKQYTRSDSDDPKKPSNGHFIKSIVSEQLAQEREALVKAVTAAVSADVKKQLAAYAKTSEK